LLEFLLNRLEDWSPKCCFCLWAIHQSYGRSIKLDDSMVFALVESGIISTTLGSFSKVRWANH